ncbi:MAG: spermidine synthase [Limisphaerales bacterium]
MPSSILHPPSSSARLRAAVLLTGLPVLALQLVWARRLTAGLGHEFAAVLSVTTATLLAMAAGAWALHGRITGSRYPGRWAAGLPALAGLWVLASVPYVPAAGDAAAAWAGLGGGALRQWLTGLAATLLVAGVPAALLGATLPALERVGRAAAAKAVSVGGVYALNTLGALAGLALAVGWAMPALGFAATQATLGGVLLLAGLLARSAGLRPGGSAAPETPAEPGFGTPPADTLAGLTSRRLYLTAGITGCLGLLFELAAVRALAQFNDNSIHSFAHALGAYLAGTALGGALVAGAWRWGKPPGLPELLAGITFVLLPAAALLFPRAGGLVLGPTATAWAVLLPPAVAMGAVFSQLAQSAVARGGGFGRLLAVNLAGAALAAPLLAFLLLPKLGLNGALAFVVAGYAALLPRRPAGIGAWLMLAATLTALLLLLAGGAEKLPDGVREIARREGALGTVSVLRSPDGARTLRVNRRLQQGGTATAVAAQRHAHLPLLLHPAPREALFLGLGTGLTMSGAAAHGARADGVELLPEVVAMLPQFAPENAPVGMRPDWRVFTADARRFARAATNRYDVIVADLFHPAVDGAAFLYTREHFEALRGRLAPGGLVCQWLPLHQLDLEGVRLITRTFLDVFPDATLWLLRFNADVPVAGLFGGRPPEAVDWEPLAARLRGPPLREALAPQALPDPVRLFGSQVAGNAALRALAGDGPRNTDDRPRLLFEAPRVGGPGTPPPHRRLVALLDVAAGAGGAPSPAGLPPEAAGRVADFAEARNLFLRGLAEEADGRRERGLALHLGAVARSADFTPAYAQAALTAGAFAGEDPVRARAILERLKALRPEQRLAADLLSRLGQK